MTTVRPPLRVLLFAHLRADRRKTVVLVLLAGVMLFLYARWLWPGAGPEAAQAAGEVLVKPSSAGSTAGAAPRRRKVGRTKITAPIARDLAGDPFALNLKLYPLSGDAPVVETTPIPAATGPDPIEEAAGKLALQSTVIGARPLACINGEFIRPGQRVGGFVLERVEPTYVVLEREGVKVELYLK